MSSMKERTMNASCFDRYLIMFTFCSDATKMMSFGKNRTKQR